MHWNRKGMEFACNIISIVSEKDSGAEGKHFETDAVCGHCRT